MAAVIALMVVAVFMPALSLAGDSGQEENIRATLPVEIRYSGSPAFGYLVAGTSSVPDRFRLTGPGSRIREMEAVKTHILDITGATKTIEKQVPPDLPEGIEPAGMEQNGQIRIRVVIEKQIIEKTVENIPVKLVHNAHPGIVRPDSVSITLSGTRLFFANDFSENDIEVRLDLKGLGPGLHVLPVEIRLPEQTGLLRVKPQVFTVQILPKNSNISGNNHAAGT